MIVGQEIGLNLRYRCWMSDHRERSPAHGRCCRFDSEDRGQPFCPQRRQWSMVPRGETPCESRFPFLAHFGEQACEFPPEHLPFGMIERPVDRKELLFE